MNAVCDFLSVLVQGLLMIAIPILVAAAFSWLQQKAREVKQNLSAEQWSLVKQGVEVAVRAAEQAGISGQIESIGAEKKAYASKFLQNYLDRIGLRVDVGEISALIEAEVHQQLAKPSPVVDNPETHAKLIDKVIETAVLASQQGSVQELARQLSQGLLEANKVHAIEFAQKYLQQFGIRLDEDMVEGLINAYVLQLQMKALKARN
ncbi:MAG: phage holin, LLH family [Chloroflexota bacterium]